MIYHLNIYTYVYTDVNKTSSNILKYYYIMLPMSYNLHDFTYILYAYIYNIYIVVIRLFELFY